MWTEVANGLDLLALVVTMGALLQVGWLSMTRTPPASALAAARLQRRADGFFSIALGLLTLTTAAALTTRSVDISGVPWARLGSVLPLVLSQTYFGHVWWLRAAVVFVFWIAWWVACALQRRREFVWVGSVCVLIQAWVWCVTAHPGDHGSFTLAVWVAVLHIFSAGLWGGSVVAVAVVVVPARRSFEALAADDLLGFIRRLSMASAVGLTLVVASGIYNAWSQLGHISDFWSSAYGQVLSAKLALVGVLIALGAGNRFARVPQLVRAYRALVSSAVQTVVLGQRHRALQRLLRAVRWEAAVLLAILVVVSVLVQTMPPNSMPGMPHH